jgi:hypothetical protein
MDIHTWVPRTGPGYIVIEPFPTNTQVSGLASRPRTAQPRRKATNQQLRLTRTSRRYVIESGRSDPRRPETKNWQEGEAIRANAHPCTHTLVPGVHSESYDANHQVCTQEPVPKAMLGTTAPFFFKLQALGLRKTQANYVPAA